MQTLVAYASVNPDSHTGIEASVRRVEEYYSGLWLQRPAFHEVHGENAGLLLWNATDGPSLWPAWSHSHGTTVASTYVPIGYERIVGSAALDDSPALVARALIEAPRDIFDIAAPFVLATLDGEGGTLDLFTDSMGVGRLFEVRTEGGWVWSNRPVAALRFAGIEASADPMGWVHSAVGDEFLGNVTPYAGVRAIDAATHIRWDARTRSRRDSVIDATASWAGLAAGAEGRSDRIEEAADGVRQAAQSIGRLFKGTPVVDLSGGRDSRLVAASFLASGTDVVLHSHDATPGDLVTAKELVGTLKSPVEHWIEHTATGGIAKVAPLAGLEASRQWHAYAEGLRPCSFLAHTPPRHLDQNNTLVVGGVGGEIAHGFFYPPDLSTLEGLPVEDKFRAHAQQMVSRVAPLRYTGASERSRLAAEETIVEMLQDISSRGVADATILDYYYFRQRMRRWGSTAERLGTVSPLLNQSFMAAALGLTPAQRQTNSLHRDIIRELAPPWADVPFFPSEVTASTPPAKKARVLRLADALDREDIASLLADTPSWADAFDSDRVHQLWHRSVEGKTSRQEEYTLRRAVWRGAFDDHLADVNGTPRPVHPRAAVPAPAVAPPGRPAPVPTPSRWRRVLSSARRSSVVQRFGRSAVWRAVRTTRIGRAIRNRLG